MVILFSLKRKTNCVTYFFLQTVVLFGNVGKKESQCFIVKREGKSFLKNVHMSCCVGEKSN